MNNSDLVKFCQGHIILQNMDDMKYIPHNLFNKNDHDHLRFDHNWNMYDIYPLILITIIIIVMMECYM